MKKLLIICFFLQASCLLQAQPQDTTLTNINTGLNKLVTSLRINSHLSVFLTSSPHKQYDLIAVNDNPAVAWHQQITGNVVSTALFKNHIVVIAYSVRKIQHGKAHDFSALIFDAATGTPMGQKMLYTSDTGKYERAFSFYITENSFKIVVKDEGAERSKYPAFDAPTFFFRMVPAYELPRFAITHQIQVFNYNDQLDVISVNDYVVKGSLIGYGFNKQGDLMAAIFNGKDVEFDKFIPGKNTPESSIITGLNLAYGIGTRRAPDIRVAASADALFYTMEDKFKNNAVFRLVKVNFTDNKYIAAIDTFTNDTLTAMEKNYVPVNKEIPKVDFFKAKDIDLSDMTIVGDQIIVSLQPNSYSSYTVNDSQNSTTQMGSVLYNVFNTDLKPLYRSVLPSSGYYGADRTYGQNSYFNNENYKLYILSTVHQKGDKTLLAILNLNNGQWDKIAILDKLDNEISLFGAVWLKDMILMPRTTGKAFHAKVNLDVDAKRY